MSVVAAHLPPLTGLLRRQAGVVSRQQLRAAGLTYDEIRAQVLARRWQTWGAHVVVTHNGDLGRRQLMWAAVMDAGHPAALASHTALELAGFRPFAREAQAVHLLVERGAKVHRDPEVTVHESRRVFADFHVQREHLPCTGIARSAVDAAAWQPWPRFACAMLAAVVQQGLCTTVELDQALHRVGRVRHKAHLREALADISGGSQALGELDLVRLCRRFGLREPDRQVRRRDRTGRLRYLDAMWELADGQRVVLEVDGAHHLDVEHWEADMRRERDLVIAGARVLRVTTVEVRADPALVARDLAAVGIPPSCQN